MQIKVQKNEKFAIYFRLPSIRGLLECGGSSRVEGIWPLLTMFAFVLWLFDLKLSAPMRANKKRSRYVVRPLVKMQICLALAVK